MKAMIYGACGVMMACLVISGCKSTIGDNAAINAALKGAPSWVLEAGDVLSAVGSAKIKSNNLNFASTQAGAAARVNLATQLNTRIESKYKELATSGADSVEQEAVQAIRTSVDQVLAGSKITNRWISEDGTLWVQVSIQKLDTELLKRNLTSAKTLDKAAAAALSQAVDEILDN